MSDGMAYPKLQLTMSDGTTYPNYNSQCQMAQFIQITTQIVICQITIHKCQMAQLIQITAHNVMIRWQKLFK